MKKSVILILFVFCLFGAIMIATSAITVSAAEEGEVYSGACGTSLTWEFDTSTGTLTIDGTGTMSSYNYGATPWYEYRTQITKIVVNNGVTSISEGALYGCSSLQELTIPFVGGSAATQVESGSTSYRGYSSRTYVIGYIFGWYTGSSGAPSGTVYQGYGYYSVSSSSYPTDGIRGVNSYHNSIFYADYFYIPSSLTKVTITGSSVIAYGAFHNCTSIKEIVLADTITKIGDRAFQNCTKLDTFALPTNLTSLGAYAFYNCDALTDIEIPTGITAISDYAINSERDFQKTQQKTPNNIENSLQMIA